MIIDAHCHTFNASDLPIKGFLYNVVANADDFPPANIVVPLIESICNIVRDAPDGDEEMGFIEGDLGRSFLESSGLSAKHARKSMHEALTEEFVRLQQSSRVDDHRLLAYLLSETNIPSRDFVSEPRSGGGAGAHVYILERQPVSMQEVSLALLQSDGPVARLNQWVEILRKYRYQITELMFRLYGNTAAGGADIFTPALVDYGSWLNKDQPRTNIEKQIEVFSALVGRFKGRILPFAPFDPRRQLEWDGTGSSPLTLVQNAIKEKGFIGVKLYPPMGFRAIFNKFQFVNNPPTGVADGAKFGEQLDQRLIDLYDWAEAKGVPVMAHCNNSNANKDGDGYCASPSYWRRVLEKFPKLRLNLAHFGGESTEVGSEDRWDQIICDLMDKYENVYADVAYFSDFLREKPRNKALSRLHFLNDYCNDRLSKGLLASRLMYGSDWSMIQQEDGAEHYLVDFRDHIAAEFGSDFATGFFGGNASRFLGLQPGTQTADRYLKFFTKIGQPAPSWCR